MQLSANRDWVDYARIVSGVLFIAAGIAKAFPQIEDIGQTLQQMAQANSGTVLAPLSTFLATQYLAVNALVGVAFVASGLAFLTRRMLVLAATGQLIMLAMFIVLLFRFQPSILVIDLPFMLAAAFVLRRALVSRQEQVVSE
ncbi:MULTISPECIES: DUF6041 domain-containing protein [unclassified Pseudovibrio]|uniref:DUF6041 domain-containing protein n=1 Tax=unclassified Pseudovibrio TaxID=2627060 RepID=UPI0007AE44B7|nr:MULTISPECIES: DUF6041 domain-containing protein [unclassified Pseudovibrio]KZL24593.1 hypothetical protein PsAD37_02608 [Pseudovibrio sp. Ad37]KZL24645.1 hypothetical protein PsWM33_02499 [Pseudovibrio sp. WM33]